MSLGAELLLRDIAEGLPSAVLLSEFGDGSPLLNDAETPILRMAHQPVGGMIQWRGLTTYAPPLSLTKDREDCARLAASSTLIVDALGADTARLIDRAARLSPGALGVLRLRGPAPARAAPGALRLVYESGAGDFIYLRRDLATDAIEARAADLMAARVDEYDALAAITSGVIDHLRFGSDQCEAVLNPVALLDQASASQRAAALGEGRLRLASDGGCALAIPQLSAVPGAVSLTVRGLPPHTTNPEITLPNAHDWALSTDRKGDAWRALATPPAGADPLISVFVELNAPGADGAEISEATTSFRRARGGWEIWDEAQSQLELEESW